MTVPHEPEYLSSGPIRSQALEHGMPNSEETEQAILGGIIIDNGLISQAIELLRPEDFYVPSHRRIFTAMTALFERGAEINPILIGEELKKENALESVGGISSINNLTFGLPHSTNIAHYAKVVRGKSMLRQLMKAANKIIQEALEQEDEPEIILEHSVKSVFDITLESTQKSFARIDSLIHKSLDKTYTIQQSGKALTGVTTGFADLDALTLGWQKSDFILIAGRPGMGKTGLGVGLAVNAVKAGGRIALFSLEQPEEQIAMRVVCSESKIDLMRYRGGYVNQDEWVRLGDAYSDLAEKGLWVDDTPAISVTQLKARAMRFIVEYGELDAIIVDYLQLMFSPEKTLYERATAISKGLKGVARELKLPLIALCQLSRAPENRTDHHPQLADLRESGALEQDADVVAFVYRGDQYRPKSEPKDNTAEIIIAKQRNGPTDTVYLRFDAPSTRFENMYQGNTTPQ